MKKQKQLKKNLEPAIGITAAHRKKSIELLNTVLANEGILLFQTLNFHWNLVGPQFHDYHLLFDAQYKLIFELLDAIAERVRAVGGIALGSMKEFIDHSHIAENTGDIPTPPEMVFELLTNHEVLIRHAREAISALEKADVGSANLVTDILEKHEKMAWMLRALCERQ